MRKRIITTIVWGALAILPFVVWAQEPRFKVPDVHLKLADIGPTTLGSLVVTTANFAIGIAGIVAIILLLFSGIQRVASAGNKEMVGESEEIMWAALTGLLIIFFAVIGLNTINPNLTKLKPLQLTNVGKITGDKVSIQLSGRPGDDGAVGDPGAGEGLVGSGGTRGISGNGRVNLYNMDLCGGVPSQSIARIRALYGSGETATINFQGRNVTVHRSAVAAFQAWDADLQRLASAGQQYAINDIGGLANRNNVNSAGTPSLHSFGIAIDINADQNGNGSRSTTIPAWFVESAYRNGFRWGGQWNGGTPDPMHFEYIGGGGFYDASSNEQTRVVTRTTSQGNLCVEDFTP